MGKSLAARFTPPYVNCMQPHGVFAPVRKLKTIFRGIRLALRYEMNFAYKLALSLVVLAASFYLRQWVDAMVIVAVTGQALAAEAFNTAIENICDFVEPRENRKIGIIKDISSAAVGLTTAAWILVVGYEYYCFIARCVDCFR